MAVSSPSDFIFSKIFNSVLESTNGNFYYVPLKNPRSRWKKFHLTKHAWQSICVSSVSSKLFDRIKSITACFGVSVQALTLCLTKRRTKRALEVNHLRLKKRGAICDLHTRFPTHILSPWPILRESYEYLRILYWQQRRTVGWFLLDHEHESNKVCIPTYSLLKVNFTDRQYRLAATLLIHCCCVERHATTIYSSFSRVIMLSAGAETTRFLHTFFRTKFMLQEPSRNSQMCQLNFAAVKITCDQAVFFWRNLFSEKRESRYDRRLLSK